MSAGSIVTWVKHSFLYGPIGIGVGIYLFICSVTVLLENKDAGNKLYHVHDVYTQYMPLETEEPASTISGLKKRQQVMIFVIKGNKRYNLMYRYNTKNPKTMPNLSEHSLYQCIQISVQI